MSKTRERKWARMPSAAMVVAIVAVVAALGGTAIAAKVGLGALSTSAKDKTVGVGKLTYVTSTATIAANATATPNVSATCPAGTRAIGGGVKINPDNLNTRVQDSYPTATGWSGTVFNNSGASATATTVAICATSRSVTGTPPAS